MNIDDNLDGDFNTFSLSPESKDHLITSARWAKIIAITSLTSIAIGGFTSLVFLFSIGTGGLSDTMNFMGGISFVLFVVFISMVISLFYMLYKFSTEINGSLLEFRGASLAKGITYLKSFFKISVLLILGTIALYVIVIVSLSKHF
jgi:hypothetical protein